MTDTPVLDLSRLRDALGDEPELITEILTMYADTARGDVDTLERACASGAAEQVIRSAHSLKGSSGNVGADRVMALASAIEQAARAGDVPRARALFPTLKTTFHETLVQAGVSGGP